MKNSFSKIAALIAAGVMAFGTVIPTFAEGATYTGIHGGTVNVEKYLIMDESANVPNAVFNYTIAPGAAQNASGSNARVFAGPTGASIGTATFAPGQTTWDSAQAIDTTGTKTATGKKDPVTLSTGEKYARSPIAVDFTGVTFNEPGIYRYIITETASSQAGMTMDSDATRVMDVYVIDDNGALSVEGYVLHNNADDAVVPTAYAAGDPTTKTNGYVNRYTSHDLTLSKAVTGNQASRDEYFEFTVTISNAVAGTVYDVDLTNADATTKTNGINTTTHTNPASITIPANATTVTETFWLQNGQSIAIKGLANNTAYSINENKTTLDNEGYTATATITEGGSASTDGTYTANTVTAADTAVTADSTVAFTNAKTGTIPTGVLTSVLPGLLVLGCAAGGIFFIAKRKKESEEDSAE